MASAEEKWKDELKDQQVMGSNANGAEGAEGKTGESNLSPGIFFKSPNYG
jgi:hypothetical protein